MLREPDFVTAAQGSSAPASHCLAHIPPPPDRVYLDDKFLWIRGVPCRGAVQLTSNALCFCHFIVDGVFFRNLHLGAQPVRLLEAPCSSLQGLAY